MGQNYFCKIGAFFFVLSMIFGFYMQNYPRKHYDCVFKKSFLKSRFFGIWVLGVQYDARFVMGDGHLLMSIFGSGLKRCHLDLMLRENCVL